MSDNEALRWTHRDSVGYQCRVYESELMIGDNLYHFIAYQPRKGLWVARVRRNGFPCIYREGATLKAMKEGLQKTACELRDKAGSA